MAKPPGIREAEIASGQRAPESSSPVPLQDANAATLRRLYQTLTDMFARMENSGGYGQIDIEVQFDEGRAVRVAKCKITDHIRLC